MIYISNQVEKIYFKLEDLIEKYKPEHLVVEELFFNKNTRTALSVGHARGIILLAGAIHNMPTFEYTPCK